MHAIVQIAAAQLRVKEGDVVFVEKLDADKDQKCVFDKVLMVDDKFGKPYVEGAYVEGVVQKQGKQKKIVVYRHNPKSTHKRKLGHRQLYTRILITKINY